MKRRPKRPHKKSIGAAAVEFGLVLPLLMLLILGGLDWGYYFFVTQLTTNAAREGARAGSLEPSDDYAASAAARSTDENFLTGGGLDGMAATVNIDFPGNAVRVEVRYPAGSLTGFTEVIVPGTARARAEMRRF